MARYFDARAGQTADADDLPPAKPVSMALLEQLRDVGELRPTILELGCGTGALSVSLAERGASRLTGIDFRRLRSGHSHLWYLAVFERSQPAAVPAR